MADQGKIIGIGGISRSGKSFLAGQLSIHFEQEGRRVKKLDQDDFVFQEDQIPLIRDHIDWECPESIDFGKFEKAIIKNRNKYDITIVEGLMVFWDPAIFQLFDFRIFMELPKEEFVLRKQMDLRWGKEPDWYIEHIWNGFLKFGQFPKDQTPNLILDGTEMFDMEEILECVSKVLGVPL